MRSFTYTRANNPETAISEIHEKDEAKFLAGGTNLIDLMRYNVERPAHVIDIKNLPYKNIESTRQGGLRLGALVTNAETAYNKEIENRYPVLSKAILAGASAPLRNMATDGGNLLQRTRCYYFYDPATPCNKRQPGTGCSAINGYNRIHAILGYSDECIAVHPSDMCVALAALEAVVWVKGKDGERSIAFEDFHRLPGNTPEKDNTLAPGEIIIAIELPKKGFEKNYTYIKLRDRNSYAFALVSVAAMLDLDGENVKEARIALGGVAHKPWRRKEAEEILVGNAATTENFQRAAEKLIEGAKGYEHNSFKIELAKRAIVRALTQATKMENL